MGWSHGSGNKSDKCRLQKAGMAFKKTAGDTFAHRIYATLESTPNDCHHLFFFGSLAVNGSVICPRKKQLEERKPG